MSDNYPMGETSGLIMAKDLAHLPVERIEKLLDDAEKGLPRARERGGVMNKNWYQNRITSLRVVLDSRRQAAAKEFATRQREAEQVNARYVRGLSTSELERRVRYLAGLPTKAVRHRWIKLYNRELVTRKEMLALAERVKTRSVKDLEVQLNVARDGASKDSNFKDWYERRVEVFEAELARRDNGAFTSTSDDDLAVWARYYKRKIDATDDFGWIKKWSNRLMAVEREQDIRRQAKGRIVRASPAESSSGTTVVLHHVQPGTLEVGTPVYGGDQLIGFTTEPFALTRPFSSKDDELIGTDLKGLTATIDFTIDNKELLELITGGTIMNWSVNEQHPLTRAVLRNNKYTVLFNIGTVTLDVAQSAYNLDKLSAELQALDVPHAINVSAAGKRLTAELTLDGFKRLLTKLL